ncbi:MAG TPA: hypothetical protein DCZ94_08790 [Lentisphaeria bacterium]|nr:MAG: hypothetical protein A2X48_23610 [Lentisphaerae bacterium GWF2_49_21]HBC87036.1 hypothetical protein [Lentisphaeria bacterium]
MAACLSYEVARLERNAPVAATNGCWGPVTASLRALKNNSSVFRYCNIMPDLTEMLSTGQGSGGLQRIMTREIEKVKRRQ